MSATSSCVARCGLPSSDVIMERILPFLSDHAKHCMILTSKKSYAYFLYQQTLTTALESTYQKMSGICQKAAARNNTLTSKEYWAMNDCYIKQAKIHLAYHKFYLLIKPEICMPLQWQKIQFQFDPKFVCVEHIVCYLPAVSEPRTLQYVHSGGGAEKQSCVS